ncbi:hypothetical protein QVG61_01690 [Thiohalobacter sp. IOR34]|uniref:hypothetical protein n=1 Tax=Thiohalobacter sp. IOR34 TaxID=3057176 RepID=UPI0025B1EE04|nr:hypothetical protein [Thiohalobacter sp. IOR34]WJW75826.1 hypothetical protein QVG61_01690 [Thiohalobacter sp. IOR34]
MDDTDIRVDIRLRIANRLSDQETTRLSEGLANMDGVHAVQLDGASQLRVQFNPFLLSGRDILKWLAQHTIRAERIPQQDAG